MKLTGRTAAYSILFMFFIAALMCGCEEVTIRPPASMDQFSAVPTEEGIEVHFVLNDSCGHSTVMMFGTGVVRIEEPSTDSIHHAGTVDTTRLLYNRQLIFSREYFVREDAEDSTAGYTYVCQLGTFPYRHFLRAPDTPDGIVRVVVVTDAGKTLLNSSQRVTWPTEVYERRDCFGTVVPFAGGG